MEVLVSAAKAAGVSGIVQVEHDMDLVERYSHRIVALQEGRVLADMSPAAFFADPVDDRRCSRKAPQHNPKGDLMLDVSNLKVEIEGSRILTASAFRSRPANWFAWLVGTAQARARLFVPSWGIAAPGRAPSDLKALR